MAPEPALPPVRPRGPCRIDSISARLPFGHGRALKVPARSNGQRRRSAMERDELPSDLGDRRHRPTATRCREPNTWPLGRTHWKKERRIMSHLIRGFTAAATIAIIATSVWTSSPRAESVTGPGSWMGVKVVTLNEGWREENSYSGAGVRVTEVEAGSPADRIGIVPGDILVAVGSTSLRYEDDLETAYSRIEQGQLVSVVISRHNGSMVTIKNLDPI